MATEGASGEPGSGAQEDSAATAAVTGPGGRTQPGRGGLRWGWDGAERCPETCLSRSVPPPSFSPGAGRGSAAAGSSVPPRGRRGASAGVPSFPVRLPRVLPHCSFPLPARLRGSGRGGRRLGSAAGLLRSLSRSGGGDSARSPQLGAGEALIWILAPRSSLSPFPRFFLVPPCVDEGRRGSAPFPPVPELWGALAGGAARRGRRAPYSRSSRLWEAVCETSTVRGYGRMQADSVCPPLPSLFRLVAYSVVGERGFAPRLSPTRSARGPGGAGGRQGAAVGEPGRSESSPCAPLRVTKRRV